MTRTPPRRRRRPTAAGAAAPRAHRCRRTRELAGATSRRSSLGGERDAARERFGDLVARQQRRAAPDRLPVPARRARRRRGGAGRLRQGVHAHHQLPRRPARSRSGSRASSSTAASTCGSRARGGCAGRCRCRATTTRRRPSRWRRGPTPRQRLVSARARRRRFGRPSSRCPNRQRDGVHALPHRRADAPPR